ncbi:MAG: hypothetical protein OEX07_03330 [Gammaproteobacteria bacterium]|nr:hypothetical protein [Gammaproteobacteria bacterium]
MTDNEEKLMELVPKLLQELQEFVDDAHEAGSDLPGTRELIEEGEQVMQQVSPWQNKLAESGNDELVFPALLEEVG